MFRIDELIEATDGKLINHASGAAIRGISTDTRTIQPADAFIAIKGDNFDGHNFINEAIRKGASAIIAYSLQLTAYSKKGVAIIKVKDTTKALGDIARFQRKKFAIPVIAVTGSNGKTTAKEMLAHVLSVRFKVQKNEGTKNNHIGVPLTLLNLKGSDDIAVLELGTNHPGEIEYLTGICLPNIGVITNIGPSHLEHLGDLKGVLREKYKMVENLNRPHIGLLNADDNLLKKKISAKSAKAVVFGFGIKNHSDFTAGMIRSYNDKTVFFIGEKYKFTLNTPGYYNIYNALSAIAAARIFGIEYKDITLKLNTFQFPPGRLKILKLNNAVFIDDTYNSNPLSLRQALDTLSNFKTAGRKIFVMGDMLELGSGRKVFHREAGRDIAGCCDALIAVGDLSKLAAEAAFTAGLSSKGIFTCQNAFEARDILFNKLSLGKCDVVLVKGSRLMKMEKVFKD